MVAAFAQPAALFPLTQPPNPMDPLTTEDLLQLSIANIRSVCRGRVKIPNTVLKKQKDLIHHVLHHAAQPVLHAFQRTIEDKWQVGSSRIRKVAAGIGPAHDVVQSWAPHPPQLRNVGDMSGQDTSRFWKYPTRTVLDNVINNFRRPRQMTP
jgi:hypothetical protein